MLPLSLQKIPKELILLLLWALEVELGIVFLRIRDYDLIVKNLFFIHTLTLF
jgi:hypothetical protein